MIPHARIRVLVPVGSTAAHPALAARDAAAVLGAEWGPLRPTDIFITGEEDYRTPMSESERCFEALEMLGVETPLVRVPGQPHGIRRHPNHHVARLLATLEWFRRYAPTAS